jgi:proton glutamate symport protein
VKGQIILKVMRHPASFLFSAIVGVWVGINIPQVGETLSSWSSLYLSALQMTVIPLIFVSIAVSTSNLIRLKGGSVSTLRLLIVLVSMLGLASLIGIVSAIILEPGNIPSSKLAQKVELPLPTLSLDEPFQEGAQGSLLQLVTGLLPPNVFESVVQGRTLQVVAFTIVFGIALGYLPQKKQTFFIDFLDSVQGVFQTIIKAVITLLPIGIFLIFSSQSSKLSLDTVFLMLGFVGAYFLGAAIFVILSALIIWRRSNISIWQGIKDLKDALVLIVSTQNSLVTVPYAVSGLRQIGFDRDVTGLTVPLGFALCKYGSVLYFAMASIFIAQFYGTALTLETYAIIAVGAVLAGLSSAGATGLAVIPLISIVLEPVGLPLGAMLVLFYAVDPVLDPIRSLLIVYPGCAATALISPKASIPKPNGETVLGED